MFFENVSYQFKRVWVKWNIWIRKWDPESQIESHCSRTILCHTVLIRKVAVVIRPALNVWKIYKSLRRGKISYSLKRNICISCYCILYSDENINFQINTSQKRFRISNGYMFGRSRVNAFVQAITPSDCAAGMCGFNRIFELGTASRRIIILHLIATWQMLISGSQNITRHPFLSAAYSLLIF